MSSFVLNRSYELQLPNSFVDVEKDEMEYVDGGKIGVWKAGWWIDQALTVVGIAVSGYMALSAIKQLARQNANGLVVTSTRKAMAKIGFSFATGTVATIIGKINAYCGFSAGVAIAKAWDSIDGYPNDGELDWI